jgi:serine/threonine protein kinase
MSANTAESREREPEIPGYAVHGLVGCGGSATVWKAYQEAVGRDVAIKVLRPYGGQRFAVQRFAREAEIHGALSHENVVAVFDSGEADCGFWLAMELVDGERLDRWLQQTSPPLRDRVQAFAGICAGVRHAHQKGIVHRDLKPGNILMSRQGVPKVADFGLAAWSQPGSMDLTLTRQGELFGSPAWMPPEQARGELQDIDTLSDLHALGAVLFFLLSGRPPIDPNLAPQVLLAAAQSDDRHLLRAVAPRIPRDLAAITDKCLSGPKFRRYQSVSELEADVRRWLDGQPVQARPASVLYWTGRKLRRHWVPAAAAVAVLSAGAGWLWERFQAERRLAEKRSQIIEQSHELANQFLVDVREVAKESKNKSIESLVERWKDQFRWDPGFGEEVNDPRRFTVRMAMTDARSFTASASWVSSEREWTRAMEVLDSLLRDRPGHGPYLAEMREVQLGLQTVLLRQDRDDESVAIGIELLEQMLDAGRVREPLDLSVLADVVTNLGDALCATSEWEVLGYPATKFPPGLAERAAAAMLRYAGTLHDRPEDASDYADCRQRARIFRESARASLRFAEKGVAGLTPQHLASMATQSGRRMLAHKSGDAARSLTVRSLATEAEIAARGGRRDAARRLLEEAVGMVRRDRTGALPRTASPGPALQLAGTLFWFADAAEKPGEHATAAWGYLEAERIWRSAHLRERRSEYLARRGAAWLHTARVLTAGPGDSSAVLAHAQKAFELLESAGVEYLDDHPIFREKLRETERLLRSLGWQPAAGKVR